MKKTVIVNFLVILCFLVSMPLFANGDQEKTASEMNKSDQIIIGYNAFGDTVDFSRKLSEGLIKSAEDVGAKVLKADTFGNAQTALANVETFLAQGADIIIDSSWNLSACEAVAKKSIENNVPVIISDIRVSEEAAYYMGVDNDVVGMVTGRAIADYAKENWDGEVNELLIAYVEAWGEGIRGRVSKAPVAARESGIDLPDSKVTYVDPQSSDATLVSKQLATDFLTAHPNSSKIVMLACNEQAAQGFLSGIETSNRTKDAIVVSVGLDKVGISNLHKENPSVWIGSTAFFPEKFGDILIPMVQDIIAGKDIPKAYYIDNVFVDRNNVAEYYPE